MIWFKTFILIHVISHVSTFEASSSNSNVDFSVELPKPIAPVDFEELDGSAKPRKLKWITDKTKNPTMVDLALEVAAKEGINAMTDLYHNIEPQIVKNGQILEENHPAALLSKFSAPAEGNERSAMAAFATLSATKAFRRNNRDSAVLGRQAQSQKVSFRRTPLEGLCPPRDPPTCMPASQRYRTHDGTCNNRRRLRWGSAQMPFNRFLPPEYGDGVDSIRGSVEGGSLSSARFVSLLVHGAREGEAPLTLMIVQWGQLLDHDMTSTAQPRSINGSVPSCCGAKDFHPLCFPIKVPLDDPWLAPLKVRCLEFLRSAPAQRRDCVLSWREQTNQVTSYIDASPIYSSSAKTSDNARIFRNGLLIYGRGDPADDVCMRGAIAHQCIRSGDGRSGEQPGLLALHHVWVGEHNRIAMELSILNPHWSDEKVYQETRRIIGALFQHITFREFLPIVLGREVCKLFDLDLMKSGYYTGYDPNINPTVSNAFAAAAFRFGHSLVQNTYMRCDRNHNFINNNVTLHEEFQQGDIGTAGSLHRLLRGLATQRALKRDEFITPELTNHLFQTPGFPFGLDLAAINIQRGRDHGIAPYTAWRQPCGLSAINTWDDLSNIVGPESAKRISHAYQNVHDIDLFVGGIAERPVIGGLVGPTFACIIAQQFSNSRKGDRFWYENAGFESSFTPAQLNSLRRVSLSSVLCRAINGGTLQPYVFLPNEAKGNQRIKCGTDSLEPIDLKPWLEQDPFFINNDKIDQNSPLHDTPISTAPMTTTKEEKGINNRIQNVTMVANVDFIPNSSIGFHRVANMTKIHDKLDMAQKLVTRPVSKPLRGISNKLDNKQRQTVKNKVKPTASSLSKRISTTRRTVVIHNVQIELRSAAGEVKKDQKYKKKPTNEQENSDLASTAKKTILKVADVVKSQISAAMGFLSNDNDDDDDTSPKHLPRKLNDPNKTNQPTEHSDRWQEIEQIYSDSETKAKETQTLTQARNSNNEIEALSDSDISTKTSNSTVTKTNQTILTNLTKNSTTETKYKQPNVYKNTDMETETDILSTNTDPDIESSTYETLLGEENNVKHNQNFNSRITSKENYETQTELSNDKRAKPVHTTTMTASELTKLTNRLKNDIPTKASQILVSDDKQTLAQSRKSNLKIEVLNDSDILNKTLNNTTIHTTTILTNLINNPNRKQTETVQKYLNVVSKNSDIEMTTGIINTNDIESFTDEHPLEEKENLTVKKDSTNQFLTIQLKVPQQHDNPQTEPKNDISTKTSYFTPKPMTVDDPSQLNTTLTLITYRPKAENMTIARNTTYDTNIPSIDKPVTDPSEKLAEPHETYNDFQAIINSALHDSLDQHKRVHRKTGHKNVNVKEVELHAHNLDFTDKLRTLRIDRSNEYDEHQQLTGSGEFHQTPDTKFDEHYFADLDDSTLPINTEQSATLRNVEHRQFPERPIYNRPQKVILDAPDSDQYEIEINIRQTNTKPPHKYGNYQDFNNPNKRYDTDRYNQNYDYKDPQENTPSDSFFTQTTRIPYGKRTKPPTIIYIDEHDDRTSTRTPGLFQNIISFATNSFNGIRQQTTSTESPFNHKPNRISSNDASDDYLSPHSSRPYKPSSENYQQAQSYPPNQAFPPPGFPQVPPNFTPSAVATASAPPQGFPPPNIYHPQSLPGANSFSTATTINGVSHASSNAVSTGHFGAIAGSASSSGGDSTFSFNIRPSARPHLNLMKPSSIKPPDYELLPQHQRPQFSSTPNYAYPPKPMPSVESFQYPPNKHDPFSSYTRRPPQYYNKYPSNVFDPAYEDIGRSELKLEETSKSDSKTNKTSDIPNFDTIEYDYIDDDIDSFVSGIFKNDNSDPQKSSDNDKIDYLKLAEQVLTNRTKLNVTEINDNFVLPVLRKSDKYIESDLSLTDNANTMEQKSVNHGILAEDYDELLTGRASLIDSKTSLITGEWNRLEKPLLNEPVAFAPIQILTKPERPDNWVIYNASDDKPQVLDQPEFITETQSAAEVPMPIQKRKKASRVPITSKRSKDENFTVENVNFDTATTLKSEVSLDIIDTTTTDEFITSSDLLEELNETSTITEDAQLVTNAETLNEEIDNENMVLTETPYDELTTLPNLT